MALPGRALRVSFCSLVALLAVFQFSENTADPDLWGHIVFGRQILSSGAIPRKDIYSWTARGQPWINHEWLAEISLAEAHRWGGGHGVLLLKMAVGLLTFALCLSLGGEGLAWPARYVTWALGALAVVEISYGFAARPQIFTALFLAVELWLLRRIHNGSRWWALALPVLFAIWINTHGGVVAGFIVLLLAAAASTAQSVCGRTPPGITVLTLWLALAGAAAALFCNPWGAGLLRWLMDSVSWMRPEIAEWNPTPLGWDHAALFLIIALMVFAWAWQRRPIVWWEAAVCAAFAWLGLRVERHAPLCAIVALTLTPPRLADALARFRASFAQLEAAASRPAMQTAIVIVCCFGTVSCGIGTFFLHKEHFFTMEVPRSEYPTEAMNFILKNDLKGRLLVFFDWGEMAIFEAPDCPPSIDGRLDTCYSRALIAAHWNIYNAEPVRSHELDPDQADLALFPVNLAGTAALAGRPGWRTVYYDPRAAVLVRRPERYAALRQLTLPVAGRAGAAQGRAAFPDWSPLWGPR